MILAIESSCDDTAAAVIDGTLILSNVIASQTVHTKYGGVIPELASRVHQQNIIPVVDTALQQAGIDKSELDAIAFTRGPGLLGSLLVGASFAKGFAASLGKPLIEVNHLQGHVLSHFVDLPDKNIAHPPLPFLCLLVSGGHTQLIVVKDYLDFEIIGETIDDAAGEAFDKCAKIMGLGYPGGPLIDKFAKEGRPKAFKFAEPRVGELDFSFSGLKTSFLYFVQKEVKNDPDFISKNVADLCASLQYTIIKILMDKLTRAVALTGIKSVAVAGGVSANAGLSAALTQEGARRGWSVYIPERSLTTDNAAMIAITAHFKFLNHQFCDLSTAPSARLSSLL